MDPLPKRTRPPGARLTSQLAFALIALSLPAPSAAAAAAASPDAQERARQHARLGLQKAFQRLQEAAGPDQRVSARAEVIVQGGSILAGDFHPGADASNFAWTGVWDVSGRYNGAGRPQGDLSRGMASEDAEWLVSGTPFLPWVATDPGEAVGAGPAAGLRRFVQLVAARPAGNGDGPGAVWTEAENLLAPGGEALRGRYAYWVGDEGVKAKINLVDRHLGGGEAAAANRILSPQAHGVAAIGGLEWFEEVDPDALGRLVTPAQLEHLGVGSDLEPPFHDTTTFGHGVLADVRLGGLKKDLTAAFADDAGFARLTAEAPGYARAEPTRIFDPESRFGSSAGDPGGPFWEQLRSYVRTGAVDGQVDARPQTETEHGYYPVITLFQQFYGLSYVEVPGGALNPDGFAYQVYFHLMPAVILWNPYNVDLAPTDYTLVFWRNTWPGETGGYAGQYFHDRFRVTNPREGGVGVNLTAGQLREHALPFEFKHKTRYIIANEAFKPGEAKVFSPAAHDEYDEGGQTSFLVNAWNPGFSFYSDRLTLDPFPGREIARLQLPLDSYRFNFLLQVSRRGGLELYRGIVDLDEPAPELPLVYIKKLNINDIPLHPTNVLPVRFDPEGDAPLLEREDYDRMYGRKIVMRMAANDYDQLSDRPYRSGTGMTKKVKWLGVLNPRSNTVGRRPFELRSWTGFYNPGNYMTHVHASGEDVYDLVDDEGRGYIGYSQEREGPSRTVLFEVPRDRGEPFLSVGQFMHANLTIAHGGSYRDYVAANYGMEEYWSDNNRPAYAIGNSAANPGMPLEAVQFRSNASNDAGVSHQATDYDHSFKLNEALWDRYFLSAVPREGDLRDGDGGGFHPLPDGRLIPVADRSGALPDDTDLRDFDRAAASLVVDGAFNVNSTSVEAWKALLSSFVGVDVPRADGSVDANLPGAKVSPFVRTTRPHGGAVTEADDISTENTYTGYRALTADEVEVLAGEIVEQVKLRGPFANLSEFVNRAPWATQRWKQVKGALQCAIDSDPDVRWGSETINQHGPINAKYFADPRFVIDVEDISTDYPGREAMAGSIAEGAPGYLTQADLLARLGPVLAARSDCFRVRACGEAVDPETREVTARAWCEAVVQRTPEYVDPADPPETHPSALTSETNRRLGRMFKVVHFRWLQEDEL